MLHLDFSILAFFTNFCPIKSDLSGNTIWPQAPSFQKLAKIDHFGHFWLTFVHSKCKRSSFRSQCWMRPFLWFSNTVWSILQKFFTSWLRKFAVVAQIQNGAEKGKILLRILGKNIVTIFLLTAVNIDLETLDSWVCYYKETKGQILALNHLVVSNFVLDQLQICKKRTFKVYSPALLHVSGKFF